MAQESDLECLWPAPLGAIFQRGAAPTPGTIRGELDHTGPATWSEIALRWINIHDEELIGRIGGFARRPYLSIMRISRGTGLSSFHLEAEKILMIVAQRQAAMANAPGSKILFRVPDITGGIWNTVGPDKKPVRGSHHSKGADDRAPAHSCVGDLDTLSAAIADPGDSFADHRFDGPFRRAPNKTPQAFVPRGLDFIGVPSKMINAAVHA